VFENLTDNNMYYIYDYIYSLLVEANISKDIEVLNRALDEIRGMRDIWKEVMKRAKSTNQ